MPLLNACAVFSHVFSVRAILSHRDGTSKSRARVETGSYKEDPELTAQLHRTLADFEADLAGEVEVCLSEHRKASFPNPDLIRDALSFVHRAHGLSLAEGDSS